MNLQTAIAGEDEKMEARTRRSARLRTVAENNGDGPRVHLSPTPNQYFEQRFPNVSAKYGLFVREAIDKNDKLSVVGINEASFVAALGPEGSPDAPTVYSRVEGRFLQYQPDDGIYSILSRAALGAQLSAEFLEAARACSGGNVNTEKLEFDFRDSKRIQGLLNTAEGQLEVSPDYFKHDPKELIAVNNGVLRLSDNTLLPHSPEHRFRSKLAVSFNPSATCEGFEKFLREALEDEDVDLYQRYSGQTLTCENITHSIALFIGNAGTGKSTLIKIHQGIIGVENCAMLRTALLHDRFELSRSYEKHFLFAPDVSGDFLNHRGASVLKSLSGGDPMTIEFKNSNEVPQMKGNKNIGITCNSRPVVRLDGDVEAWRRRLKIFSFHKDKPKKVIADLDQQILRDEGPGILNWMLTGLRQLRADDWHLKLTPTQQATVDNLLLESDAHALFAREEIVKSEDGQLTVHDAFASYVEFCTQRGWVAVSRNRFGQLIGDIVTREHSKTVRNDIPDPHTSKAQRGWRGLKLRAQTTLAETLKFDDPDRQREWDSWEGPAQ